MPQRRVPNFRAAGNQIGLSTKKSLDSRYGVVVMYNTISHPGYMAEQARNKRN
jgi:hypothetical protein